MKKSTSEPKKENSQEIFMQLIKDLDPKEQAMLKVLYQKILKDIK